MSGRAFFWFYNFPVFVLGIFWLALRIRNRREWTFIATMIDLAVIVAGASRFFGASIPPSGHALFLSYSLLTVSNQAYRIGALIFLVVTVGLKLSWSETSSWIYGILFGVALALLRQFITSRKSVVIELRNEDR